ncbi:glycosyltransferase [Stenotrophomonas indicatrix]|uniref:glycosyltransferase n=1 Tax=Stenotrophomonas indicatrix TaxID=2045451 RepID=UPI0028AE6C9A|nr:glycosyltransferase [Stenotrophomonas indicatrix]
MRILVFSFEFLPSDAPQALRVARLMRELVACGHDVDVIAGAGPASAVTYEVIDGVKVHRVNPGGVDGLVVWMKRARSGQGANGPTAAPVPMRSGLNWKGKCIQSIRKMMDVFLFPDARTLWINAAIRSARVLVADRGMPDLLIGSHEPAVGAMAAMRLAQETGVALVSELGDPILATYTPRRWQQRALRLERDVCERSAAVVLTSEATARLFDVRHGVASKLHVIPQGFDPPPFVDSDARKGDNVLRLVYTGRLYPFRNPMPLLRAVAGIPGCELVLAAPELPDDVEEFLSAGGTGCTWLGSVPHAEAVRLQAGADLVVSIGNAGMTQIPGKVLEYMGSGRPILHVRPDEGDAAAVLIKTERCGYVVDAEVSQISSLLVDLVARKRNGTLEEGLVVGFSAFEKYSWRSLGRQLSAVCERVHSE